MAIEARTTLVAELASAREARRFVLDTLQAWNCEHVADAVILLTSELVTNAILHAGTDIGIVVLGSDNTVRVEIDDHSPRLSAPHERGPGQLSGLRLTLVDVMSGSWGVEDGATGKTVWFEVPA